MVIIEARSSNASTLINCGHPVSTSSMKGAAPCANTGTSADLVRRDSSNMYTTKALAARKPAHEQTSESDAWTSNDARNPWCNTKYVLHTVRSTDNKRRHCTQSKHAQALCRRLWLCIMYRTIVSTVTSLADILDGVRHLLVLSQVLRQGLPCLLEDRRGANVDLRHHHRDRDLSQPSGRGNWAVARKANEQALGSKSKGEGMRAPDIRTGKTASRGLSPAF